MRISLPVLFAAVALLAGSVRAEAHHSFTGAYNADKQITITGKIVQIAIRSPHSFFYVESQDAKGVTQQWAVEGASAGQFARQGIDAKSFPVAHAGQHAREADQDRAAVGWQVVGNRR
jgi:hypothetical protein